MLKSLFNNSREKEFRQLFETYYAPSVYMPEDLLKIKIPVRTSFRKFLPRFGIKILSTHFPALQ